MKINHMVFFIYTEIIITSTKPTSKPQNQLFLITEAITPQRALVCLTTETQSSEMQPASAEKDNGFDNSNAQTFFNDNGGGGGGLDLGQLLHGLVGKLFNLDIGGGQYRNNGNQRNKGNRRNQFNGNWMNTGGKRQPQTITATTTRAATVHHPAFLGNVKSIEAFSVST